MKKWLITTLLVIACVFNLAACGSSDNSTASSEVELTQEQQQQWYDSASQFILSMNDALMTGQAEAQMDDPVYGPAFASWENALPDIGEIQGIEGKSCSFSKKEGMVTVTVKGSKHDADVVFTMESTDQGYSVTGITTNVIYSNPAGSDEHTAGYGNYIYSADPSGTCDRSVRQGRQQRFEQPGKEQNGRPDCSCSRTGGTGS